VSLKDKANLTFSSASAKKTFPWAIFFSL